MPGPLRGPDFFCLQFTEASPAVFNGVIIKPGSDTADDLDTAILSELRQEALSEFRKVLEGS